MYLSRFSAFSTGFFLVATLATAQMRPIAGGSANPDSNFPGSNGAAPGGPGSGRTIAPEDMAHAMVLTGKVLLDDGSVPPEPVKVERVCFGRPHAEGFTDSKGRFSVTIGQNVDDMPDATEAPTRSEIPGVNPLSGVRQNQLQNCEMRAVLAGFRSDSISLANRHYMDNPEIGNIVLHRNANVEGLTISATSALAPKDARKAYEKGLEAERKGKRDEAQKDFQKAVDGYPKYAAAWFALGRVYQSRDHLDQAREAYRQSIAADANYIDPYERIYRLDADQGKWREVADTTDKILHLNPYDFPQAYYFNAFAKLQLKQLDAAEKSAREAVKLDTAHQNPRELYVLGIILADKQQFSEAAELLQQYLQLAPNEKDTDKIREQLGEIEKSAQAKPQPQ